MTTAYESDFCQWTSEQATLLRAGMLSDIDFVNLAEEIESMGNSDRRSLGSYLRNIIMHLLKHVYQPSRRGTSWESSIALGRIEIATLIAESPSLKTKIMPAVEKVYPDARRLASRETGLPLSTFPETCPFTIDQILGDYWPL